MRLADFLDKGASLSPDAPCLTTDGTSLTYVQVQELSWRIASGLRRTGVRAGDRVAVISGNDPTAFTCVFGISRAGAVWCPINPRSEAAENRELLELSECSAVIFSSSFAELVGRIRGDLPRIRTWVCFDDEVAGATPWASFVGEEPGAVRAEPGHAEPGHGQTGHAEPGHGELGRAEPVDDLAMVVGTGGTTGRPKGVMLSNRNLETMTALTLMSYPFPDRPVYLAMAPLTHAAGVLCFPILALGGEIVIMRKPDVAAFLQTVEVKRVTHTFLPPTLVYMVLAHDDLPHSDLNSLRCLWYGAAPMSPARLEEALERIGPVMAQLFGQTEAPMMVSTLSPADHFRPDGSVATERLASAGRPTPLCTVAIMSTDEAGTLVPRGERGEVVVRGSLVMQGYYDNPEATAEVSAHGWHHTGDIGYLDDDGFLFIVDRAKDMIITGGFNVYSAEVEQAVLSHPDVQDCGVIGLPDDHWGERVVAVVQPLPGRIVDPRQIRNHVRDLIGAVKTPKQVEVWDDLPRSTVGKVLKTDLRAMLRGGAEA